MGLAPLGVRATIDVEATGLERVERERSWGEAVGMENPGLGAAGGAAAATAQAWHCTTVVEIWALLVEDHNAQPKPFVWTADPEMILDKVARGTQALASMH
jgi:hypothetical protein